MGTPEILFGLDISSNVGEINYSISPEERANRIKEIFKELKEFKDNYEIRKKLLIELNKLLVISALNYYS